MESLRRLNHFLDACVHNRTFHAVFMDTVGTGEFSGVAEKTWPWFVNHVQHVVLVGLRTVLPRAGRADDGAQPIDWSVFSAYIVLMRYKACSSRDFGTVASSARAGTSCPSSGQTSTACLLISFILSYAIRTKILRSCVQKEVFLLFSYQDTQDERNAAPSAT